MSRVDITILSQLFEPHGISIRHDYMSSNIIFTKLKMTEVENFSSNMTVDYRDVVYMSDEIMRNIIYKLDDEMCKGIARWAMKQ